MGRANLERALASVNFGSSGSGPGGSPKLTMSPGNVAFVIPDYVSGDANNIEELSLNNDNGTNWSVGSNGANKPHLSLITNPGLERVQQQGGRTGSP